MNQITSPLQPGSQGSAVADLQDALLLLIERQRIKTFPAPNRPTADELETLAQGLKHERTQSTFGDATRRLVLYFQNQQGLGDHLAGIVEAGTAQALNRLLTELGAFPENILNTVSGTIYDAFDVPMVDVTVQAFDKDLRSEQFLGQSETDANGFYTIGYDAAKYADAEYQAADIFLRVLSNAGRLLGESAVNFNVPPNFRLDLKIDNTPIKSLNEFDALVLKIKPLTEPQNVALADLEETDEFKDISFLAGETGEDAARISLLPIAFTLSAKTRIAADVFYGLLRLQFPKDLNALLLIRSESVANGISAAVGENIISAKWGVRDQLESVLQTFNRLAAGSLLAGADDQRTAFKRVIGAALPDTGQQQTFVGVYLANENTPEKFWEELSRQTGFTDPKVIAGIQSVLRLNLLTNGVPAMTALLFSEQEQNAALTDIRGFASFTFDDWHTRIAKLVSTGELETFPDGIEGTTPEEKSTNYALAITSLVKSLYPTDVFASRLKKDTSDAFRDTKSDLTAFLANNVDYDLKNNTIHKTFDASDLTGVTDKPGLKKELAVINRLYKITDDFGRVSALRLDGIDSATALVNKYSSGRFAEKFAAAMDPETAAAVYRKARQIDNRATVLAMSIKMRNDLPIYAINGPTNDAPSDYPSMFGDTNCDCEHCRSVYSPSAYFVDILNITRQYHPDDAFARLTARRSDITHILLTCKNTNTPLPYIDLVNELLENHIAPMPPVVIDGVPTYPQYQTTNSAEELLAYPEHVNTAAYDLLKTAGSADNLPLDLPLEETRLYLDKLGIKRWKLMELFYGKHADSKYNDLHIAVEYLQLSQPELNIVNGTTPMSVSLGKVADFLADTGLSYIEMLQLLECYFINPLVNGERSIKIVSTTPDQTTCNIEELNLQSASPQSLKAMPFIRLWKKTGWDILDIDRAFTALGVTDFSGDINRELIIPLSHIARLTTEYRLSVQDVLTFWSPIDTAAYVDHSAEGQPKIKTQYERLFQNKQVTNPVDADFADPENLSGTLAVESEIIIAAFNLSQKDFDTLDQHPYVDGQLTLENLSVLFRYAMLAKVLKLSVDDLTRARDLSGIDPFGNSLQTADALRFIDTIALIRSSGFSLAELTGLLRKEAAASQQIDINHTVNVLTALREGLKKIELLDPSGDTPDEQKENTRQNQNIFIADTLATAFKTESKVIDVLINRLVKSVANDASPAITPFIDAGFIASDGPLFTIDPSNVITWVFPDLFNTYVLLSDTWNRIYRLISKLNISSDEFIYFQGNEAELQISGIWNLPVSTSGGVLFPGFKNLSNIIRFRNALASPTADWFKLFDVAILDDVDTKKNFITALIGLSHLTLAAVEFLLGSATNVNDTGFLKFTFPDDYLNGAALSGVLRCAETAAGLGSSVDILAQLTTPTPDDGAASTAKNILKSKYDVPTWLGIITPLSNQLRVKKREALTSYILTSPDTGMVTFRHNHNITDIDSLYAYFLIDLEMDACMITSRIKQAIGSVQLFVDRCLMALEDGIVLSADFTTQWNTWRKRYRVWEANRKIFLYPENWIEPDLRDDKSPFFKELESTLKQNDISDATAEDALRTYLEKLDAVANLEMVGICRDGTTDVVHAIGMTRNIPHHYYYARQTASIWNAWEKIDLDIEGEHLLPVIWNNRLVLFWGIFSEKEENSDGFTVPGSGDVMPPAPKSIEIKLAWSEYQHGKWSSKKQSKDAVILNSYLRLDPSLISLNSFIDHEKLYIRIFFGLNSKADTDFLWNWADQTFVFDGCHRAPVIVPNDPDTEGLKLKFIERIHGTTIDRMVIDESAKKDAFSVLDTGIYKLFVPGGDYNETTLFRNTPGKFRILPDHNQIETAKPSTFFYNNEHNNFYVHSVGGFVRPPFDDISVLTQGQLISRKDVASFPLPGVPLTGILAHAAENPTDRFSAGSRAFSRLTTVGGTVFPAVFFRKRFVFQTFYHPYVCDLIKTLNASGVDGLYKNMILDVDGVFKDGIQNRAAANIFIPGGGAYDPTPGVQTPYPVTQVDFSYSGVYSIYNWELFFHIPLLIATRLSKNQKFDEARKWFHYIFDPTRSSSADASGTARFWITKPFKEEIQKGILSIEDLINTGLPDLDLQLTNWEKKPFNPHAVARLRNSAYMRSTVMKYIDNLIAWGDRLFQQNTLETINEATLLYVLAANMLGKKPERIPARAVPEDNAFSTIQGRLDSFSNAKAAVASFFSLSDVGNADGSIDSVMMPLFCIPKNDLLLGYWDTVADRLFKIRHCLNIQGVFQQLPLFEPPIDPALLVKAAAAGLDLSNILNDMNAALPNYRFQVLLQKANELCSEVRGLGNALLAALEKKDAEQLSLIRSSHELNMLDAVRVIKLSQRDEANENLDGLHKTREVIQARRDYYAGREFINASEAVYLASIPTAMIYQNMQIGAQSLASIGYAAPQVTIGPFSSGATYGGDNIGHALTTAAASFGQTANLFNTIGAMANVYGGYRRRQDDWNFQTQSADLELKQVDKQIVAAEIRLAIAEKELENHDLQRRQSKEIDDFLNGKYTNEELYQYMIEQVSAVYFQSYQLAYNTAGKAQKCFAHELGTDNTSFIQFGYWDSLKKGLLAGEKLQYDLRRLETAYLDQNKREFELTKSMSLLLLDPLAFLQLRETGRCFINLPEEIFDLDYPGHYFRRIKSVSLTLPCVVGPYTTLSCTLRLLKNSVRVNTAGADTAENYPRHADSQGLPADDDRFVENNIPVNAIAASHGQNDSGVFEMNFRDERYLPFEGAGAISEWSLELFNDDASDFGRPLRQFDYGTISDAILHVKYTAREDAGAFKKAAVGHLRQYFSDNNQTRSLLLFNLRREFPTEWHRFLHPADPAGGNIFALALSPDLFPLRDQGKTLKINTIWLLARCTDSGDYLVAMTPPLPAGTHAMRRAAENDVGGLHFSRGDVTASILPTGPPVEWQLRMTRPGGQNLEPSEVEDVFLVLGYEWEVS